VEAGKVSTQAQALSAESAKTPPGLSDPEPWVELYGDYLFKYALMRLRDAAKAEDATALSDLRLVQTLYQAANFSPRGHAALRRTRRHTADPQLVCRGQTAHHSTLARNGEQKLVRI